MSGSPHRRSLTQRLVIHIAVATLLAVSALTVTLLVLLHHHVHEQTDLMLLRLARQDALDALHEVDEGIHVHETPLSLPSLHAVVTSKYALVLDPDCALAAWTDNVAVDDGAPASLCEISGPEGTYAFLDVEGLAPELLRAAVLVARGPDERLYTFVVGVSHEDIDVSLWRAVAMAVPAALLAILAIVLAAWSAQRRTARELCHISEVAAGLDASAFEDLLPWHNQLRAAQPTSRETATLSNTLSELLGRLEHMIAAQDRFIAEAAHELRTPLTALRGEIELALRRKRSVEEYQEALEWARGDVERLVELAERLLSAARARAQRLSLGPVSLGAVVDDRLRRYRAPLEAAGIEVSVEAPPGWRAWGHRGAIEQVIDNLIANVLLHAEGARRVKISGGLEGGECHLRFADDGPGVSDEVRPHLFEPFQRSHGQGGHGLGLYIARDLMRRQGGDLELEEGEGASWRLSLQVLRNPG